MSYLHPGLAQPVPAADGLDKQFWQGLDDDRLFIQRCNACQEWQWGPEWVCHHCHSFDLGFEEVAPVGTIYSFERVWHPVHPALNEQGPYLIVLVSLDQATGVRVVGNLLGDPEQDVAIGARVKGVFEHHVSDDQSGTSFSLLQWATEQ